MRVDRLNEMEEYILSEGTVPLEKLAARFDVSTNTVRRDVNELIKRGRIRKVYGGVSAITEHDTNLTPVPLQVRAVEHSTAKNIIGRLAAGMVSDGDTIFLDSGTTVACMVPYLAEKEDVTIVTHSLNVMCDHYGIALQHHQADSDSHACAQILLRYLADGAQEKDFIRTYRLI